MPNIPDPLQQQSPRTTDLVNCFQLDTSDWTPSTVADLATVVLAQPAATATPGDNDTSVATTAFVTAAITAALGGGSEGSTVVDINLATPPAVIAPQTSIVNTPVAFTDFSHTTVTGGIYTGRLVVYCSTDQAAEGARFDFDGGTTDWAEFRANIVAALGCTVSVGTAAADGTDLILTSLGDTTVRCVVIEFSGSVTTGGTFIPRFAQSAHSAGTLTIALGTHFDMTLVG